ncbi:DUF1150 family protein [uncultured Lentibacter sp.]|uniref:DUF1150 family protein n=1 Tax=uncultured Lentibacter sp. TaxID=1659309 RepID=UPI00262C2C44|nr:DUF1150 family protein [uncultured Lentibacter sp.]MCW1954493.1 DUF1150 domain-containing protein [Roseobacter sp.]
MNTVYDFKENAAQPIVYVREVALEELPEKLRAEASGLKKLYAVHDASGERLALVKDRKLAFVLARQNDMMPVTAH